LLILFTTIFFWFFATFYSLILVLVALALSPFTKKGNALQWVAHIWGRGLIWLSFSSVQVIGLEKLKNMQEPMLYNGRNCPLFR